LRDFPISQVLNGMLVLVIALVLIGWVSVARIIRGAVLAEKHELHVEGARQMRPSHHYRERACRQGAAHPLTHRSFTITFIINHPIADPITPMTYSAYAPRTSNTQPPTGADTMRMSAGSVTVKTAIIIVTCRSGVVLRNVVPLETLQKVMPGFPD
jgi:hypothetical protein